MKMNHRVFSFGNIWVTWKQIGTNPLGSLGSHHYLKLLHSYYKYKKKSDLHQRAFRRISVFTWNTLTLITQYN